MDTTTITTSLLAIRDHTHVIRTMAICSLYPLPECVRRELRVEAEAIDREAAKIDAAVGELVEVGM